ncbi:MAG: pilus assembly protein [Pseudomonadota bacterium]|nr:pilus assembly protein [Pseudomonadota bacterium]
MALVLPLLLLLMFGSFELGNYFLSEHVVQKGVRDAARYASRLPITDYPACDPTPDAELRIQQTARTGAPGGTALRLRGWDDDTMTEVELECDTSGTHAGIYTVYPFPDGVPTITVSASVPYPSLFSQIGLGDTSLTLNAQSQAAIFAQ